MAEENVDQLVETLKDRKITCAKLKSFEGKYRNVAQEAGKYGFSSTMGDTEVIATKIKKVRTGVCKLR